MAGILENVEGRKGNSEDGEKRRSWLGGSGSGSERGWERKFGRFGEVEEVEERKS